MSMFKKVVIIGTGLIGGSIGLGLKKRRLAKEVIGFSRRLKNARLAKRLRAIDRVGSDLSVVQDADLVILATPVDSIVSFALKISRLVDKKCIVIDVGSTKAAIVRKLSRVIPNFLGCHPLAGSEKKGIRQINGEIFKNSICVITPIRSTAKSTIAKIKRLWQALGARVIALPAKDHDRILGFTSHLPHLLAFTLIDAVPRQFFPFSASGLKDTTRIAASDAGLWSEIFLSNRSNCLDALAVFQTRLLALQLALRKQNKKLLIKILQHASQKRKILK